VGRCRWLGLATLLLTTCARTGFEQAGTLGAGLLDAGPSDVSGGSDPQAAVLVSALQANWSTTGWVMWSWTTAGVAADLAAFEFVVAESPEDVVTHRGTAVASRHTRVSLGFPDDFDLSLIEGTLTDDHVASRSYYAQMTAVDTMGRRSTSAVAETRTSDTPSEELVIFHDTDTPGYSIPAELVLSDRAPYAGTHHYEWRAQCGEASCYEILRRQELGIDLGFIDERAFETAFFEVAAANNSSQPSITRLRIWFGTSADHDGSTLYQFSGWATDNDDQYQLFQIPLRALVSSDDATPITLEMAQRGLFEFAVDGEWSNGALVRLDEWRLRW